jgi:DNA-binding SARP family transcriptional activator/tetratricopeptide (TPR) repeat protein
MDMNINLLGPFEVRRAGEPVPISGGRSAVVLATLALSVGRPVGPVSLSEQVWGTQLPQSAAASLQSHVMRLRRVVGADTIRTVPAGYLLDIEPDQVDLWRFRRLVSAAGAAQRADEARELLGDALALWRGEPLDGLPSDALRRDVVPGLVEERLVAFDRRIELDFAVGRHAETIVELGAAVARYPLRETSWRQLITALAAVGRNAEALDRYHELRMMLRDQFGVDPSADLRELYQRLLRDDRPRTPTTACDTSSASADDGDGMSAADLPLPDWATADPAGEHVGEAATSLAGEAESLAGTYVPRSDLPGDIADLTGRQVEIGWLLAALPDDPDQAAAPAVLSIDGMAGVGKTALAVHLAHQLAERCPDGQLFIDLRGHTPGQAPIEPAAALASLLAAVGVGDDQMPESVDKRAALWRAKLAGRRVLILLDNAANTAQVRPLLPGAAGCVVIITSRRRLPTLAGARALSLDVLPRQDALRLLGAVAGDERLAAEPAATREVLELCGNLPLAIRIAGARLAARPAWTVDHLARRLRDHSHRLAELTVDDHSVAAAFTVSYQQLTPELRYLFRVLGVHPGPDIDVQLAAAIADIDTTAAERGLEDLLDAHLLLQPTIGRYRFHDLLRDHARQVAEQSGQPDAAEERRVAVARMLDYYLVNAGRAARLIEPATQHIELHVEYPPVAELPMPDQAAALEWCERERANVVAVVAFALAEGWYTHAWQLPQLFWLFFQASGHVQDWLVTAHHARQALEHVTDPRARPETLKSLGAAYFHAGRFDDALDLLSLALAGFEAIGNLDRQASTLGNLGILQRCAGNFEDAARLHRRALDLYQRAKDARGEQGSLLGEGTNLLNLGNVLVMLGRYEEAIDCHKAAIAVYQELGDRHTQAGAMAYLAIAYQREGRTAEAFRYYRRALRMSQESGARSTFAVTLSFYAALYAGDGYVEEALKLHCRAVELIRETRERSSEAEVRNNHGGTLLLAGRYADAVRCFRSALELGIGTLNRYEQGRAHHGLARAFDVTDPAQAAEHRAHALHIFTDLGVPEAATLRAENAANAANAANAERRHAGAN